MRKFSTLLFSAVVLVGILGTTAWADEVTAWNTIMFQAAFVAGTSPLNMSRNAAIVQAAVFDAVNGIERKFTPVHVEPAAPPGASRRAATVQAAYATLIRLYPAQKTTFLDPKLASSLAAIASEAAAEHSVSIDRGVEWGQTVADGIWTWRAGDGFNTVLPPYVNGVNPGEWRPTPPAFALAVGRQFATMTTWVMSSFSAYRPPAPPSLGSGQYAVDFAEVKSKGQNTSITRTADETLYSRFWNSTSASYLWDQIALSIGAERHLTFSEEARMLALMNIAMADAAIGCWDAKYRYKFWRPVTAIQNDGIPADATWLPLLVTPAFPEYPSGHSCVSGAAGRVLSNYFGEYTSFSVTSDSPAMVGVTRSFSSFSEATQEVRNARVFAGIHFRTACDVGQDLGINVADDVLAHALLPVHGAKTGELRH